jgi:hypothetical protein
MSPCNKKDKLAPARRYAMPNNVRIGFKRKVFILGWWRN